ncbi:MAG: Gfo/Idh/MocA family oxidoreductase [Deltaproteobacteria bacterium]|nr:Gfo/Idh/MocA family oxidoreductase [Deltaproteobacteria bacterium]
MRLQDRDKPPTYADACFAPTSICMDRVSLMLMKTLRIGLIGVGKHGSRYAKHIVEDVPQAALAAVCRRNRQEGEQLAADYGCSYYADYRALLADRYIDAVAIVVPPAFHGEIVEAACQAGKHILIEKPLAVSVAEARRIRDCIAASDVRCMVAHTLRFNAVVQALKAHIPQIALLHSIYLSQRFEPSPLVWLDRKAESGGGIVLHTGVHSFDLLRFLSGSEVEQVWCQTSRVFTKETEDNFLMMCRLNDPPLKGAVAGSRSTRSRSGLIELSGENGQLLGDHTHGFAYLVKGLERTPLPVELPVPTVRETLKAFVEGLQNNKAFPITVEDGLRAVAVAEACYRSAISGQAAEVEM